MSKMRCTTKAQAMTVLKVIAESLDKTTSREALEAVAEWIREGGGMELKIITEAEAEALNS